MVLWQLEYLNLCPLVKQTADITQLPSQPLYGFPVKPTKHVQV